METQLDQIPLLAVLLATINTWFLPHQYKHFKVAPINFVTQYIERFKDIQ